MMNVVEPCGLGARIAETREATENIWGSDGVNDVLSRVDESVRTAFDSKTTHPRWVPERWFIAWMNAVWEGPCKKDFKALARWSDEVTDCGFGRATKLLLSLASPWVILRRADALWRGDHTHGNLRVARLDAHSARMTLSDHPFIETEVGRAAISEAFRHILWLSRARLPHETHEYSDGLLHVHVRWR